MLFVDNLISGYGKVEVIQNVSFKLSENEKLSIIGPNGCGKTTLLKTICGLLNYKGNVYANNKNIKDFTRKELSKNIALTSQVNTMLFKYSVYDTVSMGRYVYIKDNLLSDLSAHDKEVIDYYLNKTGLYEIKDKDISELSGGQLQRVFLARSFVQEPKILLLDEPTNHLDIKYQIELINIINEWVREENHSIISVIHDINMAISMSDRLIVMNKGSIVADDLPQNILNSEIINSVYCCNVNEYMFNLFKMWNK